jgi:hypothetical protein
VLRIIFGPKRDEIMGVWRILHNEELHNLYSLSNTIRMTMSRKMRWAVHVARIEKRMHIGDCGKTRRKETTRKTKTYMGGQY